MLFDRFCCRGLELECLSASSGSLKRREPNLELGKRYRRYLCLGPPSNTPPPFPPVPAHFLNPTLSFCTQFHDMVLGKDDSGLFLHSLRLPTRRHGQRPMLTLLLQALSISPHVQAK